MPSEIHQFYKEHEYCVRCHKQPAPIGQAVCFACIDQMADGKQRARAQGLCLDCWHAPVVPQRRYCAACLARRREQDAARKKAWDAQRVCCYCGKHPRWLDQKGCFACWEKRHGR